MKIFSSAYYFQFSLQLRGGGLIHHYTLSVDLFYRDDSSFTPGGKKKEEEASPHTGGWGLGSRGGGR